RTAGRAVRGRGRWLRAWSRSPSWAVMNRLDAACGPIATSHWCFVADRLYTGSIFPNPGFAMGAPTAALLQEAARLHGQGALAEAASRFREVLQSEPEQAVALYHLAVIACQQGRFGEGIELVRRSLASDPRQPRAHNLLGMASGRLGHQQEALASFDAAIAQQPDFADAHGNRANALL